MTEEQIRAATETADRVGDRLVDVLNEELAKEDRSLLGILAGIILTLHAVTEAMPGKTPIEIGFLRIASESCLNSMLVSRILDPKYSKPSHRRLMAMPTNGGKPS